MTPRTIWLLAALLCAAFVSGAEAEEPHGGHQAEEAGAGAPPAPPLPEPRASALPGAGALLSGLFQVQDSIVQGDRGALKLQADILKMMREQLLAMRGTPILPSTDIAPVLLFGLAGGDPVAAVQVLTFVPEDHPEAGLTQAVVDYLRRDTRSAVVRFETIDPLALPQPLGAYVAMAKANSAMATRRDVAALNFNLVRLLAPGTLLEEVALRRLVWLNAGNGDAAAFYRVAGSYANRFATSPYFGQFLKFFMDGAVKLPTDEGIRAVLDLLPEDARIALKMRLSRQAVIAGREDLADIVSSSLLNDLADSADDRVQRAHLYAGMTQVAKGRLLQAWGMLKHVRRESVPAEDRELLDAALNAVREATDGDPESADIITSALGGAPDGAAAGESETDGGGPGAAEAAARGLSAESAAPAQRDEPTGDAGMKAQSASSMEAEAMTDLQPLMDEASRQLEAVDELLRNLPK
ncbi:MAG: hypothetical protein R3D65_09085 [Zhengella sp.]|uniref:hypothetical protein n=1 Tax=Zhengella sp. TaxID=2282762 RepID=UPI001DADF029|nr:hypothetical protein [Notoacmeibacter sp.]MCC0025489.1 hypothetical protein [Brucellaceae bacterium]